MASAATTHAGIERPSRVDRVLARIDEANAADPNVLVVDDEAWPKERIHGRMAEAWIERLVRAPSDALRVAARGHHLRRWEVPRASQPEGRAGYHRWRKACQRHHAAGLAAILEKEGCDVAFTLRVVELVRKRGLASDPEVQALEDALCLVFLETQLADFAARHAPDKALDVLRKTLAKMTANGRRAALCEARLDPALRALVRGALPAA